MRALATLAASWFGLNPFGEVISLPQEYICFPCWFSEIVLLCRMRYSLTDFVWLHGYIGPLGGQRLLQKNVPRIFPRCSSLQDILFPRHHESVVIFWPTCLKSQGFLWIVLPLNSRTHFNTPFRKTPLCPVKFQHSCSRSNVVTSRSLAELLPVYPLSQLRFCSLFS